MSNTMDLEPLRRLSRDLKKGGTGLSKAEARFLVDGYYILQDGRIRAANQVRALTVSGEPHEVIGWFQDNSSILERNVASVLDSWTMGHRTGRWVRSVYGVGPVLAAGLLAHVDPTIAVTAGKLWRFAGLDPTVKWEKGQKRPWNARLKVICWKLGESFKKFSNREECFYGHLYRQRKAQEVANDAAGKFADQATAKLRDYKIRDKATRERYESGHLPDGRLDLRATRWAVKIFLAHYQAVAYEVEHGRKPPRPWIIEHGGHAEEIVPPGWPCD